MIAEVVAIIPAIKLMEGSAAYLDDSGTVWLS